MGRFGLSLLWVRIWQEPHLHHLSPTSQYWKVAMANEITYRMIVSDDGPSLEAIMAASPDAGMVQFSYDYSRDLLAVHRAFAADLRGVVAVAGEVSVGMLFGDLYPIQWGGLVYPSAYISNLRVLPDYRRQGIANGMAQRGLSYLESEIGTEFVLFGAIMEANISLKLAQRYGFQSTATIQGGTVPMRRRPPSRQLDLIVRQAEEADLEEIAAGMNTFYRDYDLWSPVKPAGLKNFINQRVGDIRPNRLYVAARGNHILAGLSLSDRTQLVRMKIEKAPAPVRALGGLLGILPRSGVLKALTIRRVWFKAGELAAGRYLWQELRYQLRQHGDCLGIAYDPRSPLANLFQVPFWLPMFKARYLVRATTSPSEERLIYCLAGP
jgi:ribosomal protein S18 acetylase RimI-like enzyme